MNPEVFGPFRVVKRPPAAAGPKGGATRPVADVEARIARLARLAGARAPLFAAADRDGAAERGEAVRE